jgi:hypothetical protein
MDRLTTQMERLTTNEKVAAVAVAIAVVAAVVFRVEPSLLSTTQAVAIGCGAITSERPALDEANDASTVVSFPLTYAASSGVYQMQFYMGDGKDAFTAVPDTGSEFMVVTGANCSSCNTSDGVYDMSGTKVTSVMPTLAYGSQTDTVEWYIDNMTSESSSSSLQIQFAVVTNVTGDTNSNIFGLATSQQHCEKAPILDQLMFEQQETPPYFTFDVQDASTGSLTIGSEQPGGDAIPLLQEADVTSALGGDLGVNYYMIACTGVTVDDSSVDNRPTIMMIDTGNTEFSCSAAFYSSLTTAMTGGQNLTISFGSTSVNYTIDADTVAACAAEPWLDESEFGGQVAIFGNRFMQGHVLSFNLADFTMSIQ